MSDSEWFEEFDRQWPPHCPQCGALIKSPEALARLATDVEKAIASMKLVLPPIVKPGIKVLAENLKCRAGRCTPKGRAA